MFNYIYLIKAKGPEATYIAVQSTNKQYARLLTWATTLHNLMLMQPSLEIV